MQTTKRILITLLFAIVSLVHQNEAQAANFVTKVVTASGANWSATVWSNPPNTAVSSPAAGNTYELVFNGTVWGNNLGDTRMRNPATDGLQTFPGDSLTVNADTDIRFKKGAAGGAISATISHFPGVGGQPGLILNGGVLNPGDDITFVATGRIHVASQSILSGGDNGGGAQKELRSMFLRGTLTGPGNLVILQSGFTTPHMVDADGRGYTGSWIVQAGYLQGLGSNSLGYGHIVLAPTNQDPASVSTNFAKFEPMYDLDTPGTLYASNNPVSGSAAQLVLHQNLRFARVIVDGVQVPNGFYDYATIAAAFPTHVAAGGSGGISVGPATPTGLTALSGDTVAFLSWAGGPSSLGYIVKRAPGTGGPYTPIATNGTATTFLDTNLVNGTAYFYVVSAINDGGESTDSNEATVTPNIVAPAITADPQSATNCTGTAVSFSATASGHYPLIYQWYFNTNTPLANETNATLTLNNVQLASVGTYNVVVTNSGGSATGAVAFLALKAATVVSAPPANATNCPGTAAAFSVTATGEGTLTYTWRKGGVILQGPDGNNSYTIAAVTPADAGAYSVEVNGECNNVTNSATLTVVGIPAISAQPQNQLTPMGNGAVFSVTTSTLATQPTTYQWQTNGVDVTGANASTFAISNLTLAANGMQVRVAVSNCAGGLISSAATLTVIPVHGISFDFNTPGQFTNAPYNLVGNDWMNNLLVNNQPWGPVTPFEVSTGGVGVATGGGALDLMFNRGDDQTSTLLPVTFDFSLPGKTLTASMMVKVKVATAAQRAIQIGFMTATNQLANGGANGVAGLNGTAGIGWISAILQSSAPLNSVTPSYQLRAQLKPTAGTATFETIPVNSPTNTFNTNTWYKIVVKFTNTKDVTANSYNMDTSVQDMGRDGQTPGATVLAYSGSQTNLDVVNASRLWFAIRGFENGGNDYWDNISVTTTGGNAAFVSEPSNQTVLQGRTAEFRALVDGDGPYTYQWNRNGSPIPGAGNWKYATPQLLLSDDGAEYTVTVTGPNNSVTSMPAVVTVQADDLDVLSVGSVNGSEIGLRFDQPVTKVSAEVAGNYLINGVPAVAAQLRVSNGVQQQRTNGTEVLLTPATPVTGVFSVTVANVTSISGTALSANNSASGLVAGLTGFDIDPITQVANQFNTRPGEEHSFAPGHLELTGGGHDSFGNFDGFRFDYQVITGDFDIKARIPYLDALRSPNKGGFNARVSLDAYSPNVGAYSDPQLPGRNFYEGTSRQAWNVATISWGNNSRTVYPDNWVRLRRVGNTFIRYSSTNGVNWLCDGQISPVPAFPPTLYVGPAAVANVGTGVQQLPVLAQFESLGSFGGYPGATITISQQPTNQTIAAGNAATIAVTATASGGGIPASAGELSYVWQRTNTAGGGWTNLLTAGATNNTVSSGNAFFSDNGAQFRAIVSAPGALSVTSAVMTLTVTDTAAPTIAAGFIPTNAPNIIMLKFNEPLSAATALNPATYTVTNAAGVVFTITSVTFLNGDPTVVVITTTDNLAAGNYGVFISGLRDLNNNLVPNTVRTFTGLNTAPFYPVVIEYYGGLATAGNLGDLTSDIRFTTDNPNWITYSNAFGVNQGATGFPTSPLGDNYGIKMYSYFVPTQTQQYVFWWRADDFAQFFINTNAVDSTNPAGKVGGPILTANNPNYVAANTLVTPPLNAGQSYYIELIYKEGGGGDGGVIMVTPGSSTATAPAATTIMGSDLLAFPDALAKRTPVLVELYTGIANWAVANGSLFDLQFATNSLAMITRVPNLIGYERYMSYSTNLGNTSLDNYAGRIISYFIPPTNGNYKFYVRGDDVYNLFINTNAVNSTDPAGRTLFPGFPIYGGTPPTGGGSGAYNVLAQNINMVGGQRYFLEGLWREGGGGDGMSIAVRSQGDPTVPSTADFIPGSMLEFPTNIALVGPMSLFPLVPSATTVNEGETVQFAATVKSGSPPYTYAFYRNGVQVFANQGLYSTPPLTYADNGAVYTVVVTNLFSGATSQPVVITVNQDLAPPTITSAVGSQYGNSVLVTFSERVDPATAGWLANYSIGGLQIYSLDFDEISGRRVSLRTSPQAPNSVYTLTINGVRDVSAAANVIAANSTRNFSSWGFGGIGGVLVEVFTNIPTTLVESLFQGPLYMNNMPSFSYYTNTFSAGNFGAQGGRENYAIRMSGQFMPPSNGLYRFFIRGDDETRLYMNTNGSDPAGRTLISANNNANSGVVPPFTSPYQGGNPIGGDSSRVGASISQILSLTNGTPYYMEAFMKEGGGGDYVTVLMRAIDPITLTEIGGLPAAAAVGDSLSGGFFSAPGNPDLIQLTVVSTPPAELFLAENDPVTLTLGATVIPSSLTPFVSYQWQRSNSVSGTFVNVPGATASTLFFFAPLADDGATYRIVASVPGTTVSYTTLLHVVADTQAPFLVSASSLDGNTIGLLFSEPVSISTGGEAGNYSVNSDTVAVQSAVVRTNIDPRTVILTLQTPVSGTFTVDALDIGDLSVAFNQGSSSISGSVQGFKPMDIGAPPGVGSSFSATNGEIDVIAGGADIWGASDQGHFTIGTRTGNFDVWARVASLSRAPLDNDGITKAGIMVRETLDANARKLTVLGEPPTSVGGRDFYEAGQRPSVGAATAAWSGGGATGTGPFGIPNGWIRIKRNGDLFTAYRSSDGVNWTVATTHTMSFSNTVYVGLATTAHIPAPSSATTLAQYRNIHIPNPPTISVQPSPDSQTVPIHAPVSYSVTGVNTPDGGSFGYVWKRDGLVVAGATSATLSIPNAAVSDSGVYTVEVFNDGGGVVSIPVVLIVSNSLPSVTNETVAVSTPGSLVTLYTSNLLANDVDAEGDPLSIIAVSGVAPVTYVADFNDGLPPAGATIYPNGALGASVKPSGGTADSGYLEINPNVGNAAGSMIINELTPGKRVSAFTATFNVKVLSPGSGQPADGFSFNFGNDLADGPGATFAAESGSTASGFSFCLDNYQFANLNVGGPVGSPGGGVANSSGLKINYKGVIIAGVEINNGLRGTAGSAWNVDRWVPVSITVLENGSCTVLVDGTNVFGNLVLPNYTAAQGRFGFYGRTGGATESHSLDEINITVRTLDTALGTGTVTLSGDAITYTPPPTGCGTDTFYYIVSDGQLHGTTVGEVAVNLCPVAGPITLVSPTLNGGVFSASFATQSGVSYQAQYKDSLSGLTWTTFAVISGDGTVKPFTDNGPLPPMRFYRVIVP